MKTHKNIQDKIDNTFKAMDAIEDVKVSPFFKDKTMQRLFAEKEEKHVSWSWFTPKLQLATLVAVMLLNIIAFSQLDSSVEVETVSDFAETYDLYPSEESLVFN